MANLIFQYKAGVGTYPSGNLNLISIFGGNCVGSSVDLSAVGEDQMRGADDGGGGVPGTNSGCCITTGTWPCDIAQNGYLTFRFAGIPTLDRIRWISFGGTSPAPESILVQKLDNEGATDGTAIWTTVASSVRTGGFPYDIATTFTPTAAKTWRFRVLNDSHPAEISQFQLRHA